MLGLDASVKIPPRLPLVGGLAGLIGIFLLAGPFLNEALGKNSLALATHQPTTGAHAQPYDAIAVRKQNISVRVIVEFVAFAFAALLLLRVWNPFGFVHLFEGDYLAGFLLIAGAGLLALQYKKIATLWDFNWKHVLGAAFTAVVVPLLIYAWLDLTLTEAWMTPARWLRFPAVLLLALPFHLAEELALGPAMRTRLSKTRLAYALGLRALMWGVFADRNRRASQRRDTLRAAGALLRALLPVPTYRYGRCPKQHRVRAGGGYLRCYTPRWF